MSAPEAYGWYVVNQMRADPPKFANELEGLYKGTITSGHGVLSSDPVWTDLRATINGSAYKEHFAQAISLLRGQPKLGPLAWEDRLDTISEEHNTWMQTHAYAHSYYNTPGNSPPTSNGLLSGYPGTGINGDYDIINSSVLKYPGAPSNWSTGSWAENIGYKSGASLSATRARFGTGTAAHRQRQAYADIIGFITEVNSTSLGHLKNLLSRDQAGSGLGLAGAKNKEIGEKNAFALDYDFRDVGLTTNTTNMVTTHTFSQHVQYGGQGGYIAGVAYQDKNNNGFYDLGEGVQVSWEIDTPGGLTIGYDTTGTNYGVVSDFQTGNGAHVIRVYSGGRLLGTRAVTVNDNNAWVEFRTSTGFNLLSVDGTGSTTPTMATDLYETGGGNNTSGTATGLGLIAPGAGGPSQMVGLSVNNASDQDWFRFQVNSGTARAKIQLGFTHASGDLDAVLYRQAANGTLTPVQSATSSTDNESFDQNLTPGTYFLTVYGYSGATNFYTLNTDIQVESPLYVDYGSFGLASWTETGGWQVLNPNNPDGVAVGGDGYLYIDYGIHGLHRWTQAGGFEWLNAFNPDGIAVGSDGYVYVDYGSYGLTRWSLDGGWEVLNSINPDGIAVSRDGYLYVDYGIHGLHRWSDTTGWKYLNQYNPDGLAIW